MATGDQADLVSRLRAVIPARWFPDAAPGEDSATPVLDATVAGVAYVWAQLYALLAFVALQARVATATGVFLDMVAADFFGRALMRGPMPDASFRLAIMHRLLRQGGTRAGMAAELADVTGNAAAIVEPWRPADCGAWGGGPVAIGYGLAGAWGSLAPCEAFITVTRGNGVSDADIYATVADMKPEGVTAWVAITD